MRHSRVHRRIKCTLSCLKDIQVSASRHQSARKKSIFKRTKDVERMLQALSRGCFTRLSPTRARISPRTRPREGSFDLWRPAGRFTNIKFAFKGVDGATVERAAKATMPRKDGPASSHVCTLRENLQCCRASQTLRITFEGNEGVLIGPCQVAEEFLGTCPSRP